MQEMQQIRNSLVQNEHLNEETKNTIFLLLQNMKNKMEQEYQLTLPTHLLIERLQTLSFKDSEKWIHKELYQYNAQENIVYFRTEEIKEEEYLNVVCQSLLEIAYIRNPKKAELGIDGQKFIAIKKGMIAILANNLVGNNGDRGISEDEQIFVNMADIITNGEISQAFFMQDSKKLETILLDKKYSLLGSNGLANYNAVYGTRGDSQLGNIEMQLIDSFFRLPAEEVKMKMEMFEAHVISNPNVLARPNKYNILVQIKTYFQQKKQIFFHKKNQMYTGSPNAMISLQTGYEAFQTGYEQPEIGHSKIS